MNKHKGCLICNCEKLIQLKDYYDHHGLIKCASCGFVFMERIPTKEELYSHYSKYSYETEGYLSPLTIKSYNMLLDEFERFRIRNKILDVGCGRGWFLQQAKKRGWEVFGSEYSEKAVEICKGNDIQMRQGALSEDSFSQDEFDVITSFEAIEHINNPSEELSNIHKFLRKGGLFFCTTPNFNSLLRYYLKEDYNVINYPEHLSYYTRKTLNKLVKSKGFKPKKTLTTGISITRIKTSKKNSTEGFISEKSSDEVLRKNIDKKWYLKVAKTLINSSLSFFGIGMTLKGYYIKT